MELIWVRDRGWLAQMLLDQIPQMPRPMKVVLRRCVQAGVDAEADLVLHERSVFGPRGIGQLSAVDQGVADGLGRYDWRRGGVERFLWWASYGMLRAERRRLRRLDYTEYLVEPAQAAADAPASSDDGPEQAAVANLIAEKIRAMAQTLSDTDKKALSAFLAGDSTADVSKKLTSTNGQARGQTDRVLTLLRHPSGGLRALFEDACR